MSAKNQEIIDDLVEKTGLRLTSQREKILRVFIENRNKHLSVDNIYFLIKNKGSSTGMATIYRTVDLLEKIGAVVKRDFGDDSARYEFIYKREEHHHLICRNCGRVIEISGLLPETLKKDLLKKSRFKYQESSLKIYGYCEECRKNQE